MTTFYNAIKGLRHGEECPREAGTRLEPRTALMQRNSCPASLPRSHGSASAAVAKRRLGLRAIQSQDEFCCRFAVF